MYVICEWGYFENWFSSININEFTMHMNMDQILEYMYSGMIWDHHMQNNENRPLTLDITSIQKGLKSWMWDLKP